MSGGRAPRRRSERFGDAVEALPQSNLSSPGLMYGPETWVTGVRRHG